VPPLSKPDTFCDVRLSLPKRRCSIYTQYRRRTAAKRDFEAGFIDSTRSSHHGPKGRDGLCYIYVIIVMRVAEADAVACRHRAVLPASQTLRCAELN